MAIVGVWKYYVLVVVFARMSLAVTRRVAIL